MSLLSLSLFVSPLPVTVCPPLSLSLQAIITSLSLPTNPTLSLFVVVSVSFCHYLSLPVSVSSFICLIFLSVLVVISVSVFMCVCFLVTVSPPQPPTHTSRHLTSQLKVEAFQSLQTLSVLFHGLV